MQEPVFDQRSKRDPGLLPFFDIDRLFVCSLHGVDAFLRHPDIFLIPLDPDPVAAKHFCNRVRFTNAHETMIWAQKKKGAQYTFNHQSMKKLNDDLQMRSDWNLPIANGKQRIKSNGTKAHSTQKPEALLYRIIMASSNVGDVVLDPFFGSGTTGAVAKMLGRNWIGIERDEKYIRVPQERIDAVQRADEETIHVEKRKQARVPFGTLIENGLLNPGQILYFAKNGKQAKILSNGHLKCGAMTGSIHGVAKSLVNGAPVNGWDVWFYEDENGKRIVIDALREKIRSMD